MGRPIFSRRGLQIGQAMLVTACMLLTASLVIPWLYLTTSFFPGADGIEWFSPGLEVFYLLVGQRAALAAFSLAFLFVAAVILVRTTLQLWRPARINRGGTVTLVITLALVGLSIVGVVYFAVPFALSFGYPYYDVTPELGGYFATGGLICALAGAALLEPAPIRQLNSATSTSSAHDEK